jgi:hypothetical protein
MVMLQEDPIIDIRCVQGHYEGFVDGHFVVSGDTWNEVYSELQKIKVV